MTKGHNSINRKVLIESPICVIKKRAIRPIVVAYFKAYVIPSTLRVLRLRHFIATTSQFKQTHTQSITSEGITFYLHTNRFWHCYAYKQSESPHLLTKLSIFTSSVFFVAVAVVWQFKFDLLSEGSEKWHKDWIYAIRWRTLKVF